MAPFRPRRRTPLRGLQSAALTGDPPPRPGAIVIGMAQADRISRYLHRMATAPWLITLTHGVANDTNVAVKALDERITALKKDMEAQFEALTLLTRAVNELNSRLQEIAKVNEPTRP